MATNRNNRDGRDGGDGRNCAGHVVDGDFNGIQIGVVTDGSNEVVNVVRGDTSGVLIQCDDFYGDVNL